MDFRHIRAFIAVADASSVTKAAARLHITQPPLTRHIHQLERELGVTLFVRHRQGVTLTQAGRQLLDRARRLDAAAIEFVSAARHAVRPDAGVLRIGIGWGLWDLVHRVRVEFGRQFPNVAIEATDAFCHLEADHQLKNRTLDLVFARPPYDAGLEVSAPILHEPIQAVVADSSPLARAERLSIRDLAGYPLLLWDRHIAPALYDRMLELYARAGVDVPKIPTPGAGPYNHAGLMLVASGTGIYLGYGVPLTAPQPASGVAVRPLSDPGATMEVCAVSRKDSPAIVTQFIETIWQVVPAGRVRRFA
jgi:DNA-binding transcriptional LysR family regulator